MSGTIIVNADDFGLHENINKGILCCCDRRIVSSVSIATVGAVSEEGMRDLLRYPGIGRGVHLCLNDERPLSPAKEIGSIVSGGVLCGYRRMIQRMLTGAIRPGEVYIEWKRQIERALERGIVPDHLDTHNHVHLFPVFFDIVTHLAEEFGIPAIRYLGGRPERVPWDRANAVKYLLSLRVRNRFADLGARGIAFPDAVSGFYRYGDLSETALARYTGAVRPRSFTEIICHPGFGHSRDTTRYAVWDYGWDSELKALERTMGSPHAGEKQLATYGDLSSARCPRIDGVVPPEVSGVSIVIPARNEFQNIQKTIRIIDRFLGSCRADYEILVVDDASTDGTKQAAAALLKDRKGRVIERTVKEGYGAALRSGFGEATKEWILYLDADYPAHIGNALRAFRCAGQGDLIIGCRSNSLHDGIVRYVYRKIFVSLVRLFFGLRVPDVNFAFKFFRKTCCDRLHLVSNGTFIDAEMLIKAREQGFAIKQLPMESLGRTFGRSQLSSIAHIAFLVREAAVFYVGFRRNKHASAPVMAYHR